MQPSSRVVFLPPTENEFSNLLGSFPYQSGGTLDDIRTVHFAAPSRYHQRGAGFFSTLANIAKSVVPFLFRSIKPTALKFTQDVIHDVGSGQTNVRGALKKRGFEALREVGSRLIKGGKKRKRRRVTPRDKKKKNNKKKSACRRKNTDVFDIL